MKYTLVLLLFCLWTKNNHGNEYSQFNLSGTVDKRWEFVRNLFLKNFVDDVELGASIAIYHQGQLVVDLKAGWFDESKSKPYDDETLQIVFSTTKGVVAMAVALCVDKGLLNYTDLVTKYWPEYGQYGKENSTVADLLSHRAGLPHLPLEVDRYKNWTHMIQTLEEMKPLWTPGMQHGYHSVSYGWLAGELVRRVDPEKRSFGQFFKQEIADKLDIEFYIGLPSQLQYRASPVVPFPEVKSILNDTMKYLFTVWNDPETHRSEIPAAIGLSNARSIAKLYAAFIGSLSDCQASRIVRSEIMRSAIKSNTPANEIDLVLPYYSSFAMGFQRYEDFLPGFGSDVFGHHGKNTATYDSDERFPDPL